MCLNFKSWKEVSEVVVLSQFLEDPVLEGADMQMAQRKHLDPTERGGWGAEPPPCHCVRLQKKLSKPLKSLPKALSAPLLTSLKPPFKLPFKSPFKPPFKPAFKPLKPLKPPFKSFKPSFSLPFEAFEALQALEAPLQSL